MRAWFRKHRGEIGLTPFTLGELRRGIEWCADAGARPALERKFREVLQEYRDAIYVFDEITAGEWGRMMAEMAAELPPWDDSYIAAIARSYELTVVTRNEKHFRGCRTVNPWSEDAPG